MCVHYYAVSNCCEAEACAIEESKLENVQWIAFNECNRCMVSQINCKSKTFWLHAAQLASYTQLASLYHLHLYIETCFDDLILLYICDPICENPPFTHINYFSLFYIILSRMIRRMSVTSINVIR